VLTVNVPWARPRSGFTLLFEALVITFGQNGMTPSAISRIVGEYDTRLWRVLEHYVDASRANEDYSKVTKVGVDETSRSKGHTYVTIFADIEESKVIYVTEGRDHKTVENFRQDLEEHGGEADQISDFALDMSKAFIKCIEEEFGSAYLTFDKFHVLKLINTAVDEVRRAEQ
jgi:transposase